MQHGVWSLILGVVTGAAYSAARQPARRAYIDNLMTGGSLGVPLWSLISVIAVPLLSGQMPEWTAEQIRQHFPALAGWVVYGASLDRKSTRLNSSHTVISYAVFCLKKKQKSK